jgi:hypothetical protein
MRYPNLVFLHTAHEILFIKGTAFFLMEQLNYPIEKMKFSTFKEFEEFGVDSKTWIIAMGKYSLLYPFIKSLNSTSLNWILLLTHPYLPLSKKELRHHNLKGIWYVYDINIKNIKDMFKMTVYDPPYMSPSIQKNLLYYPEKLSLFDQRILKFMIQGLDGKKIYQKLSCSESTLTKRKRELKEYFEMESFSDCAFILKLYRLGVVTPEQFPNQ